MEHKVFIRPCAVRVAGFSVSTLEDLSLDEQRLETRDEREQGRVRMDTRRATGRGAKPGGILHADGAEIVEEIAEANLVRGMG
jgi:hypothetical protein